MMTALLLDGSKGVGACICLCLVYDLGVPFQISSFTVHEYRRAAQKGSRHAIQKIEAFMDFFRVALVRSTPSHLG